MYFKNLKYLNSVKNLNFRFNKRFKKNNISYKRTLPYSIPTVYIHIPFQWQFVLLEKNFIKQMGGLENNLSTQKEFLLKMGIKQRAEIISRNQSFLKKADIYYRLEKLIDEKQMGNLFKVLLIKNKKNKFKLGF